MVLLSERVTLDSELLQDKKITDASLIKFTNCQVLRDHDLISTDVWVESGKILNPEPLFFVEKRDADLTVDCENLILAPGYIDTQINGAFGCDFSTPQSGLAQDVQKACKGLLSYGVTSFCPTVVSSQLETYAEVLPALHKRPGSSEGSAVLGVHLEGPFINPDKRGAHCGTNILHHGFPTGTLSDLEAVYGKNFADNTAIVTLAPELSNATGVVKDLVQRGIVVSLGHSMGSLISGEEAVKAGASSITHLFNAMLPFHHRDPGLVGLLASKFIDADELYFGVIADGIHTHPSALRIAHRTHPTGLVLVTDAMAALGLGDGAHKLGDFTVVTKGLTATLDDSSNTLAGSVSSMDHCVRHLLKAARCSVVEALECATLHPARLLKMSHQKGTLSFGSDADFVLLDEGLQVCSTFIAGQSVWTR